MRPEIEYRDEAFRANVTQKTEEVLLFIADWALREHTHSQEDISWMDEIDEDIDLAMFAYRRELSRLLSNDAGSPNRLQVLEHLKLLSIFALDHLFQLVPDVAGYLPNRQPQNQAEKTRRFLFDYMRQLDSALVNVRQSFPDAVSIFDGESVNETRARVLFPDGFIPSSPMEQVAQ